MSLLMKAVSDFISLTDTPAAYAAQARMYPRVNVAEDALEFVPGSEGKTPVRYLETNLIYNGNNPLAWTALDTTIGGEGIVFLKVVGNPAAPRVYSFRRNGDVGDEAWGCVNRCHITNADRLAYICVPTDAAGLIEWFEPFELANVQIWVIGYWLANFVDAVIATGVGTGAWETIDTGVPSSLVYVQGTSTEVGGNTIRLRETGDALWTAALFSAAIMDVRDDYVSYAMMMTNEQGEIDMYFGVGLNFTLTLVAYINPSAITQTDLFDDVIPVTGYRDIATPFGRGFTFLRWLGQNGAWSYTNSRENGAVFTCVQASCGCTQISNQVANQLAYNFVPLIDYTGIFEFGATTPNEWAIRAMAMFE